MLILMRTLCFLLLLLFSGTTWAAWSLPSIPFFHHKSTPTAENAELTYQITGLSEDMQKNVVAWLTVEQKNNGRILSDADVQRLFEQSDEAILEAVKPYGYFKARIIRHNLQKLGAHRWQAHYQVEPATPLRVTKLSISISGAGAKQAFFQEYLTKLPLAKGDILQTPQYELIKKNLNDLASQHGYLSAHFTESVIKINLKAYTSEITLHFDTGPQYYFGHVVFKQKTLSDSFLQRYVRFKPGMSYSPDALLKLQQDLSNTPYFKSVDVEPDEQNTQLYVPITVNLVPTNSQHYNFGVGYGTDTGIRGTVGWSMPHITKSGQNFNANIQASQIQNSLEARYIFPGKDPNSQQTFIGANVMQESPNTSEGHTQKIVVGSTNSWHSWKSTLTMSQQWDRYSLRGDPFLRSHLLLPGLNISKVAVDDPVFPRFGYSISLNSLGAAESLLSTTSFFQTELAGKYIFSPTKYSRVILRGDIGITSVGDINTVPLSLQFFAGGSDSVRGYNYEELGPGRYLMIGSLELQHQIFPKWFGTVFIDEGNAVNNFTNPEHDVVGRKQSSIILSDILKTGIGTGVVWVSPVGPMELTIAKPVTDPGKSLSIQFSMGTGL